MVCPAYAGMIPYVTCNSFVVTCLSRVCGDDPKVDLWIEKSVFVCPAYAGMIPVTNLVVSIKKSLSRVCGDDPSGNRDFSQGTTFVPRMRG